MTPRKLSRQFRVELPNNNNNNNDLVNICYVMLCYVKECS